VTVTRRSTAARSAGRHPTITGVFASSRNSFVRRGGSDDRHGSDRHGSSCAPRPSALDPGLVHSGTWPRASATVPWAGTVAAHSGPGVDGEVDRDTAGTQPAHGMDRSHVAAFQYSSAGRVDIISVLEASFGIRRAPRAARSRGFAMAAAWPRGRPVPVRRPRPGGGGEAALPPIPVVELMLFCPSSVMPQRPSVATPRGECCTGEGVQPSSRIPWHTPDDATEQRAGGRPGAAAGEDRQFGHPTTVRRQHWPRPRAPRIRMPREASPAAVGKLFVDSTTARLPITEMSRTCDVKQVAISWWHPPASSPARTRPVPVRNRRTRVSKSTVRRA
jgi:hypothetical protein